jgi:hypothetical protein
MIQTRYDTLTTPFPSDTETIPKLVKTWKFNEKGLKSSMHGKGAVFSFPVKCASPRQHHQDTHPGEENASRDQGVDIEDDEDKFDCSQQLIEKSIVVVEEPDRHNHHHHRDDDDDEMIMQEGKPRVHTTPQTCKTLSDGTMLCQEKIITEYYLPKEQAVEELNGVLHFVPHVATSTVTHLDRAPGSNDRQLEAGPATTASDSKE